MEALAFVGAILFVSRANLSLVVPPPGNKGDLEDNIFSFKDLGEQITLLSFVLSFTCDCIKGLLGLLSNSLLEGLFKSDEGIPFWEDLWGLTSGEVTEGGIPYFPCLLSLCSPTSLFSSSASSNEPVPPMIWVRWRPGVGGGAWFSLNASNILFSNRSSFFLSATPPIGSEICSGVGGIDLGLPWAGEEWIGEGAVPAPIDELLRSPRREEEIRFLLFSPCLESALSLVVLLCASLSEETLEEDEDVDEGLLDPDDCELRLLAAFAFRCSLRFSRSSFLCRVASDEMVGLSFSPSTDCLGVPSSGPSSLPSDVLSFLSGDWNTEDVVELGLSGTLSVALPSMTSSWEALALSNASALEESAFLIGCCGVWGWLGATAALPLPDP